jgi:hypothetical protein
MKYFSTRGDEQLLSFEDVRCLCLLVEELLIPLIDCLDRLGSQRWIVYS